MGTKFPHHMIKEIYDEPKVVQAILDKGLKEIQEAANEILSKDFKMIYITGSGTSYHASLIAQFAFSTLTELLTVAIPASEFTSWIPPVISKKTLLIAFSQSGESSDILTATRTALDRGINTLAITNTPSSSITKMSDYTLLTYAGEELAVTATKSYTAQLATVFLLVLQLWSKQRFKLEYIRGLQRKLLTSSALITETIHLTDNRMQQLAEKYSDKNIFFLLGRGPNYATALEGALKLKETCNMFAEGFATREFLHGPIQLVDEKSLIFIVLPKDEVKDDLGLVRILKKFGAQIVLLSEQKNKPKGDSIVIGIPAGFPKIFSPILYIIPLQLFSYYSSIVRGLNPDTPKKLTKIVK